MVIYQLTRKTQIGSSFLGIMRLDNNVIYFTNKEDAKALQNRFNGDKIKEIQLNKTCKFVYTIRLISNTASFGQSFDCLEKAKAFCESADTSRFSREVFKNKVYSSLQEFKNTKYESKQVYA